MKKKEVLLPEYAMSIIRIDENVYLEIVQIRLGKDNEYHSSSNSIRIGIDGLEDFIDEMNDMQNEIMKNGINSYINSRSKFWTFTDYSLSTLR